MTIRITGMNSGLDTESIISELASARSIKVQSVQKAQTKLSWKIDAWKSLNTKIYSFYSDTLSDMRLTGSYALKKTKSSNESAVSVLTSGNAVNGTQTMRITALAKTGYLTGAALSSVSGGTLSGDTALSDLGISSANEDGTFGLKVKYNGEEKELTFKTTDKISDVTSKLKELGLNANFDTKTNRFFVSSPESGALKDFTISAADGDEDALAALGLATFGGTDEEWAALSKDEQAKYASKIDGQDAEIYLNNARFTSTTNVFEINGLTITAQEETGDKEFTLTTSSDTTGIYDLVKNFFKKYNELINEMDKMYNAKSAKSYEPLTDDEKDAMSDTEVETWENKIKEALLRKDSTLNTISSALKDIMAGGIVMEDGSKMYLSHFGIETLGYFKAAENEHNAYHIDGDSDDEATKSIEDKLKTMITTNPDQVVEFFTKLSKNMYTKLTDLMGSTDYSSAFTIYDDKRLKKELDDYNTKITDAQDKLNDYMDKWYDKFAQMETALSKINSKSSSLGNMFGGM